MFLYRWLCPSSYGSEDFDAAAPMLVSARPAKGKTPAQQALADCIAKGSVAQDKRDAEARAAKHAAVLPFMKQQVQSPKPGGFIDAMLKRVSSM